MRCAPLVFAVGLLAGCGSSGGSSVEVPDRGGRDATADTGEGSGDDDAGDVIAIDLGGGGGDAGCAPEGAQECVGQDRGRQCEGGVWHDFACSDGWACAGGACVPPLACTIPGTRSCDGDAVVVCQPDGSTVVDTLCEGGCRDGACRDACAGDGKTYLGCVFYALDLDNAPWSAFGGQAAEAQQFAVTVSNPGDELVEVTIRSTAEDALFGPFTVAPGELVTIPLPRADVNDSVVTRNSYAIRASAPVTAHQFNPQNNVGVYSNDASLLLPATSLDTDYMVVAWPTEVQQIPLFGPRGFPAYATIVAVAEGPTTVSVTAGPRSGVRAGTGVDAFGPGETKTFRLEQGEVVSLMSPQTDGVDLTGMRITATQPVGVFVGNECANVPHGNVYCDHLEDQLLPTSAWGRRYVAPKLAPRGDEPDVYRVVALQDGTTVSTSPTQAGVPGRTLAAGEVFELVSDQDFVIEASAPIAVAQLMVGSGYPGPEHGCIRDTGEGDRPECAIRADPECGTSDTLSAIGDPALVFLVPDERHRRDYVVLTPADYRVDALSIVVPDGVDVTLDGAPLATSPRAIPGAGVGVARVFVADGPHRVSATGPVGLYAYGYDCDVSYAYAGGLDLAP
ncbi:MAG: IgGFc-binding protein [Myxococcales bacterium]|nr:IgGFc-binding protein [Myxococcales bacterium]MCB9532037.1 IgGFc-binding protein [Myxococcales bacterium]